MSVLQLRRNMVVKDASARAFDHDDEPAEIVEIEKPFPLRTLEPAEIDAVAVEIEDAEDDGRSFLDIVAGWVRGALIVGLIAAYPVMVVMASGVGDRNMAALDRAAWTAPWAGAASTAITPHFDQIGWAPDASFLEPMARLTAKPAYQQALAQSTGEYIALMHSQSVAAGRNDTDLEAAARLITAASTADQLRAGRDALMSHDRRLRRTTGAVPADPASLASQLALIETWAAQSQNEIAASASALGGSPVDQSATVAVYNAKGRAMAAYVFVDAMAWPDAPGAVSARNAALDAWKAAARFRPLVVLNASPDGSVLGNHPASMGYLIAQAQQATTGYRRIIAVVRPSPANVESESAAADSAPHAP